ncbi:ubl carboxyl-terminal hydrolase 18 isoform X2 [Xenopus tropicalis]|uniref:Ubl carboxyl-terminal hydrolase 18 isoform X2 n=1 Tax=Xenopus tropicalis TaxID=8364 RepID=A0A8J0SXC2_XENTR|nr:ubl carboxyl-terminal hydrolase 18 isoform X2 [Xenopus tropicalis]|eukprot:XP_017944933.1 PREDICTED: ubl carboxyl-terminal hydrolase 18 isoform X2 [Xenopus tropicalis]
MQDEGYASCCSLLEEEEANQAGQARAVTAPVERLSYSGGKFKNGAVGLCNIGVNNCLNPLLQTLYMNQHFTDLLCGIGHPNDNVPAERRLPYELLALFEEMQNSKEDAVAPYRFLRCLQILDTRLCEQHDAADFLFMMWNLLLQQMPLPHLAQRLRALYGIKLKEHVTCHKCSHEKSSDMEVLTIPLPVPHSKYQRPLPLQRALWRFFKPHEISEDNFCPKCAENTAGQRVLQFFSLPQTLSIHLKRISRRKTSDVQKINRTFSFPCTLDLSDVLDQEQFPVQEHAQSDFKYRLFAVIAHSGTASFGHYCAYINSSKDQTWYSFNDSSVCKVSWDDVKCTYGNMDFHFATACLLVYLQGDGN